MDESANEDEDEPEPQSPDVGETREELSAQRKKEIEAIQRAMDEENERVGTSQSRQIVSREAEDEPKSSRGTFISSASSPKTSETVHFVCYAVPQCFFYNICAEAYFSQISTG